MTPDWSLDVGIAPEGALRRIAVAINRPKKRAFGVFKTENEYVGVVGDPEFEIWERHQRAVHAFGRVRGERGGTGIEVRFFIPPGRRALIGLFFVLYAVIAVGLSTQGPQATIPTEELLIAVAGAAVLAAIFAVNARRQRADLRTLLERLFADVKRG